MVKSIWEKLACLQTSWSVVLRSRVSFSKSFLTLGGHDHALPETSLQLDERCFHNSHQPLGKLLVFLPGVLASLGFLSTIFWSQYWNIASIQNISISEMMTYNSASIIFNKFFWDRVSYTLELHWSLDLFAFFILSNIWNYTHVPSCLVNLVILSKDCDIR